MPVPLFVKRSCGCLFLQHPFRFAEDGVPVRSMMYELGEDLPDHALLVDEVRRGPLVTPRLSPAEIRGKFKLRFGFEVRVKLAVRFDVFVFLGDGDHDRRSVSSMPQPG